MSTQTGLVTGSFGHRLRVEAKGQVFDCVMRGKQSGVACGDRVEIRQTGSDQAVIEKLLPRDNLLYRSVAHRSKLIAANVDLIVIVVAPVPAWHEALLNRCLVAAEAAGIPALLCINKSDLPQAAETRAQLDGYETLGYRLLQVSAHGDTRMLAEALHDRTSVLVGQSGMGKSSLINALVPSAASATGEISVALDSGRHTTTGARMYRLESGGRIIDSPGMQTFGLHQIAAEQLDRMFPEFRPWIGQCRFSNCRHRHEPDCAVQRAAEAGSIRPSRMAAYLDILTELERAR